MTDECGRDVAWGFADGRARGGMLNMGSTDRDADIAGVVGALSVVAAPIAAVWAGIAHSSWSWFFGAGLVALFGPGAIILLFVWLLTLVESRPDEGRWQADGPFIVTSRNERRPEPAAVAEVRSLEEKKAAAIRSAEEKAAEIRRAEEERAAEVERLAQEFGLPNPTLAKWRAEEEERLDRIARESRDPDQR
jgi:hypothetical protein